MRGSKLIGKVTIQREKHQKLLDLVPKHAPRIVCGFLVGDKNDKSILITDVREIRTRCNKRIHFQPVFADFRRVANEIHKEGKTIVGEFHTHPEGSTEPTGRDMKIMRWMKTGFWIICSRNTVSAMLFDAEEFKTNITKIPVEVGNNETEEETEEDLDEDETGVTFEDEDLIDEDLFDENEL